MNWLRCFLFAGALLLPAIGQATDETISLNLVNADIETVVKAVAQATGRNFAIDPRVKGTVTVVSGKPIPRAHLYAVLLAALRMQGYAAVESGNLTRIVPEADAKTFGMAVAKNDQHAADDRVMTRVFQLRFAAAAQAANALRPLVAPNNTISPIANGNMLLVTDYAANLKKIESVIEAIDQPEVDKPLVIRLEHASALDLAQTLGRLLADTASGGSDAAQRVTIVPDVHANALLVSSGNVGKLVRVRELATALDEPGAATGNIHVVYLRNAEASKLAQTLRAVLTGSSESAPPPPGLPAAGAAAMLAGGGSAASGPAAGATIQADAATNALIITASEPVYRGLRQVVDLLDRRRAQVYVEALVVELTADRASEFGIQWQSLSASSTPSLVGGTNFGKGGSNIVGLLENAAKAGQTGSAGVSPGLNIGILTGRFGSTNTPNLAVLLRALETDAHANILSTPTLVTLDNEEAKIVVGQNLPFITGQYAQSGGAVTPTPFQTIERRDVGLTLKIRPQISEGGTIRLDIYQEASAVEPGTITNAAGPVTNKRMIQSSVLVDDNSVIVLGGLIEDNYSAGEDKVPLLGDIPGIGALFRYESRKRTKTNLMVFLRPKIMRDVDSAAALANDRYGYILGEQKRFGAQSDLMRGEAAAPALPPLPAAPGLP